jgi:hypothetical protein
MPGSLVSKKRLLCEGWLDEGCEPGDGLVMFPTTGYVEQGKKVWVAFGEHKLDESSGQAVVERFEDLDLEERRVGDEVLRLPKGGRWFVEGPFQRSDVENANRRKYPRGIWERLIADDASYVQKSIKERAMVGHLEHPGDGRTDGSKGAILVTKATLEKDGTVMGQAEILDTPMGLILQEYTKKRVRWGVSSRGNGSVKDDGTVDTDNYVLETWDAVMKPSVPGAYPKPKVSEGVVESLTEVEIGDTVVVKQAKNVPPNSTTGAFIGKRGRVIDMEKDGPTKMWRVRFDDPVKVPGVGDVEDDLFSGAFLRKLREDALAEDSGDVPLYFNAYDVVRRKGKQVAGKQSWLSNDVASSLETHLSAALDALRARVHKMVRSETLKRVRDDKTLVDALANIGFELAESIDEAKTDAATAYKENRDELAAGLADFQRKLKKHAADFAASGSRNYGYVGDVGHWNEVVRTELLGAEESEHEHPSDASVTEGLEGDAKEYGLAVSALVETDLDNLEAGARAKLHRQLLDAMGRGSALADVGHLSDQAYRQLQGWLTSKLSESMGADVADIGDAIDEAIRQATVDETADRRDGFARVTTSLKNRLRDALTEAQSYRERLEAAESRATAADGQFRVAVEQLAEAEAKAADLGRRLSLAEGLLATRPAAEPSGAVVSAVEEAVRAVPALDEFRSLLERSGSSDEVQRLAEALLPRVVEVREIPDVPRPTGLVAGRPTLPHGRVKSADAPSRVSESTSAPRGAQVAAGAMRLMETKQ